MPLLYHIDYLLSSGFTIPAKPIRKRFSENVINTLLEIKWWDWSKEKTSEKIHAIQTGEIDQLL